VFRRPRFKSAPGKLLYCPKFSWFSPVPSGKFRDIVTKSNIAVSVVWGLECWPLVPKFAGSKPAEAVGFFRGKSSQRAFLRSGSKAVGPMSQICVELAICRQNYRTFFAHSTPFPASGLSHLCRRGERLAVQVETSKAGLIQQAFKGYGIHPVAPAIGAQ
jgi:hypothetical protein